MRNVEFAHELLEPRFEPEPVVQNQIGLGGAPEITRSRFVAVNLGAKLGDRLHLEVLPRHIARDIGEHRERGEHDRLGAGVGTRVVAGVGRTTTSRSRGATTQPDGEQRQSDCGRAPSFPHDSRVVFVRPTSKVWAPKLLVYRSRLRTSDAGNHSWSRERPV